MREEREGERGGGGGREKDCRRGRWKKGRRAKGERWEMEEGRGHCTCYTALFRRFLRSAIFLSREWNLLRYVGRDVPTPTCVPHVAYPCGYLSCSQSYGSFPSEMSVLEVEDELEWNPSVPAVTSIPLSIYDDGAILYYK